MKVLKGAKRLSHSLRGSGLPFPVRPNDVGRSHELAYKMRDPLFKIAFAIALAQS
jgi:hypothetical protein